MLKSHKTSDWSNQLTGLLLDDLWVVAEDEASAHNEAKALLEKNGIPKDSDYKLVKVQKGEGACNSVAADTL